ncbi:MAG: hypothetical protein SVK54_07530 [candidate division WOR-3 bacterium]|nr:hypothetical protein [candidate division WOR-3 bacterium]
MNFDNLMTFLIKNNMQVFSYNDLRTILPDAKQDNLKRNVYNWVDSGKITRLKRGLFQLAYPGKENVPDIYIANRMYEPSYISLDTALSIFNLIPEIAMTVTSVTSKATRRFNNQYGTFVYRTLKRNYFTGYSIMKEGNYEIKIADPEKAIADYLYLNNTKTIDRIDKTILRGLSKKRLDKYCKLMNVSWWKLYA